MLDPVGANLSRFQATRSAAADPSGVETDTARLEEVATEFEALFVEQMLTSMRDTLNTDDRMLHGGTGEEYFEDMLYSEYAKLMAKRMDFGIADMITKHHGQSGGEGR
ncbi:MAG: rod-binding protein [Spirochaetaceae bacterium]